MNLLEIKNLTKNFGGLTAVSNLSFQLNKGEILGLIGPNGAGKTTAFNLITGFIKPTSGKIFFENKNITNNNTHSIVKKGIARTFQIVKPFRNLTVLENVILGVFLKVSNRLVATKEAFNILEKVNLTKKANSYASDLTLGEQKRLEIARCLGTKPKVLFLDEPMGGLNPSEIDNACNLVKKLKDTGISIILVEHHMKAIMKISDKVIVLQHGIKIAEDVPEKITKNKTVIKAYLGGELL
jgi:branched-chain amino acid transport system ATP-binding protein